MTVHRLEVQMPCASSRPAWEKARNSANVFTAGMRGGCDMRFIFLMIVYPTTCSLCRKSPRSHSYSFSCVRHRSPWYCVPIARSSANGSVCRWICGFRNRRSAWPLHPRADAWLFFGEGIAEQPEGGGNVVLVSGWIHNRWLSRSAANELPSATRGEAMEMTFWSRSSFERPFSQFSSRRRMGFPGRREVQSQTWRVFA